jgi:hypothetical protein
MEPLSCLNCCHNPLQLGVVGTAFGYCTRHRLVLLQSHHTTCGQLLRKDLLAESALREAARHVETFTRENVWMVRAPSVAARERGLVEEPNGELASDAVYEDVRAYGKLETKIASLAKLWRTPGVRAETALLSLGRAYFQNCIRRGGAWTAGLHLLWRTLERVAEEPELEATELRGPISVPLPKLVDLAKWSIIAQRLALISDVGGRATTEDVASLKSLADRAMAETTPSTKHLLGWLRRHRHTITGALPRWRYEELATQLTNEEE